MNAWTLMANTQHVQVYAPEIKDYVDWGLIGVLREIWQQGIQTIFSCEGPQTQTSQFGYILFNELEKPHYRRGSRTVCEALRRWNFSVIEFHHAPLPNQLHRMYVAFERDS